MRRYRLGSWRRALNAVVAPLIAAGLAGRRWYLLTAPGRRSGRLHTTPVWIILRGETRWLVAPYGERNWVRNARAAGWVELRRGRNRGRFAVEEVSLEEAVSILREYYRRGILTRPFFDVSLSSSHQAWLEEAPRHPVLRVGRPMPPAVS